MELAVLVPSLQCVSIMTDRMCILCQFIRKGYNHLMCHHSPLEPVETHYKGSTDASPG